MLVNYVFSYNLYGLSLQGKNLIKYLSDEVAYLLLLDHLYKHTK